MSREVREEKKLIKSAYPKSVGTGSNFFQQNLFKCAGEHCVSRFVFSSIEYHAHFIERVLFKLKELNNRL